MSKFRVDDQVAIVTGGGTGIGLGCALTLAEHGSHVVLAGRRSQPLEAAAEQVRALGRNALVVPTDVTKVDQCEALVETAFTELGRLDILVNNAGGASPRPIEQWTPEEWHDTLALNLGSVWFLSRFAAPVMMEHGKGSIVNISSGASLFALPAAAPYGASKAGVNNLTMSMAAAWTPKGIRVNCVASGAVRSETLLDGSNRLGLDESALGAGNAMARIGEPDEIGYAVLYFASDASSFCSGQTLWVNGGPKG
jgi:NAD(P)-dependent dehydrogenase (short-subunit alcohol dehydrogenase family)